MHFLSRFIPRWLQPFNKKVLFSEGDIVRVRRGGMTGTIGDITDIILSSNPYEGPQYRVQGQWFYSDYLEKIKTD